MLPDFNFYTQTFLGNKIGNATEFARLAKRAEAFIEQLMGGRVSTLPPDVYKNAVCAVAEAWQTNEQGGDLSSQSVGSWSRAYANKPMTNEERLTQAAMFYLPSVRWA